MATKTQVFSVPSTGIGNPDYSQTIDKIKRGETYSEFVPRVDTEKYKIFVMPMLPNVPFGPFTALQIGETRHYMDVETFMPAPYIAPAGIISDFREWFFSCDGRVALNVIMDGIIAFYMPVERFANVHQYEQIVWGKTDIMDPDALLPHTWDFTITNLEAAQVVTGTVHVSIVLKMAGL